MRWRRQRAQPEYDAQCALLEWARYVRTEFGDTLDEHIVGSANGSKLYGTRAERARQMHRMKRAGVKEGAADLLIAIARSDWHGLWIEMKKSRIRFGSAAKARAAVSKTQRDFGVRRLRAGYLWVVCYGLDEAIHVIERYLAGQPPAIEFLEPLGEIAHDHYHELGLR